MVFVFPIQCCLFKSLPSQSSSFCHPLVPMVTRWPFHVQNCHSNSLYCTCRHDFIFRLHFSIFSHLVSIHSFSTSFPLSICTLFLHTCRGWQPGRSWEAGCHGNNKQVAAGYRAGEKREQGDCFLKYFKWVCSSSLSHLLTSCCSLRASL